jgi:hypothetical protein
MEHAHPEGWQGQPGTCLTATVTANTATSGSSNVAFIPYSATTPTVPTNVTWEGLRIWQSYPTAYIIMSGGVVISADFRLDALGGSHGNSSYGFGWAVGDQLMSMSGSFNTGSNPAYTGSSFHAVITSVGSQMEALPYNNSPGGTTPGSGYRTPGELPGVYGLPAPGAGGPAEPAPPAASLGAAETSSHNIMDPSNQLDDQQYITTVLNTGVVPSYLSQEQILFMSDEDKVKRAKILTRMTLSRLRDAGIWKTTKDVSDGVLTADDFIT